MLILICGIFSVLFIGLGVFVYTGRGWFLIAGYNTSSKSERDKYDERALCRFIGKIIIAVGLFLIPLSIESIAEWYWIVFTAVTLGLGIFASVYSNTGNRFKK